MMRILHLVISLDMGGLEKMVCALANAQMVRRHQIYMGFVEYPGALAGQIKPVAAWIGDLEHRGRWQTAWSLARFVRKHKIDVIHSHDPQPHFYAVLAHLLTGVPVIHTKHGRNYPDMPRRVFLNRVLAWFSRKIVAVSEDVAELARSLERTSPRKVAVVRNGVDCGTWDVGSETWDVPPSLEKLRRTRGDVERGELDLIGKTETLKVEKGTTKTQRREGGSESKVQCLESKVFSLQSSVCIGTVGRLSGEKNYALLLQAFAQIPLPEARLLLVGDGPERGRLEALAAELGVSERAMFAGLQADPIPFYAEMDVFCLSSDTEGTPMTLLEAGACGLPSVVTDVGGCAEVVQDGATGLVVPKGDAMALAAALEKLCRDVALRARMGQTARERVMAEYSVEAMVAGYERVYRGA